MQRSGAYGWPPPAPGSVFVPYPYPNFNPNAPPPTQPASSSSSSSSRPNPIDETANTDGTEQEHDSSWCDRCICCRRGACDRCGYALSRMFAAATGLGFIVVLIIVFIRANKLTEIAYAAPLFLVGAALIFYGVSGVRAFLAPGLRSNGDGGTYFASPTVPASNQPVKASGKGKGKAKGKASKASDNALNNTGNPPVKNTGKNTKPKGKATNNTAGKAPSKRSDDPPGSSSESTRASTST